MSKHVDDLKLAASKEVVLWIVGKLEAVFGPLKIEWNNFTNCGVRHDQNPETFTVKLDQIEYIDALKPIDPVVFRGKSPETPLDAGAETLFRSLLGAVAFACLTRVDIAVFVVALQRMASKATILHIKRLNVVVRYMKRYPMCLVYERLDPEVCLLGQGDSAFKKEEETGYALKGGVFMLIEKKYREGLRARCHLLEFVSARERHVTRSTFGAELFSACDVVDLSMLLSCLLHQVDKGSMTPAAARRCREDNGWDIEIDLGLDAMSVYAAVTALHVKAPAEKALLTHVQYLRELLDRSILKYIVWFDTRDMTADGLTKGACERAAIHKVMAGTYQVQWKQERWTTKLGQSKFSNAILQ